MWFKTVLVILKSQYLISIERYEGESLKKIEEQNLKIYKNTSKFD